MGHPRRCLDIQAITDFQSAVITGTPVKTEFLKLEVYSVARGSIEGPRW